MKLRNLFFASVALAGLFSACSNEMDEVVDNSTKVENAGDAYMQIGFAFPSTSGTRATSTDPGVTTEQSFENIALVIVNKDKTVAEYVALTKTDFSPEGNTGGSTSGKNKLYVSKSNIKVTKQTSEVDVYVFVNPTTAIEALNAKNATLDTRMIHSESAVNIAIAQDGKFLMSNVDGKAESTKIEGSATAPTVVKVSVERVAAKLVEQTPEYAFNIDMDKAVTGYEGLTITLSQYAYINLNKTSFVLKQYITEAGVNYVEDTNFKNYTPGSDLFFYFNGSKKESDYNFCNMKKDEATYCLENTALAGDQYTDKTTGVIYKAVAQWNGKSAGESFYSFINKIYFTFDDVNAAYKAIYNQEIAEANKENVEELAKLGITYYKDGICYYRTMIKHEPNDAYLAPMEFAIVRNNVYQLKVNSIKGLGEPTIPTTPDPDEPDPTKAQLQLTVDVVPWTVRENNFDL